MNTPTPEEAKMQEIYNKHFDHTDTGADYAELKTKDNLKDEIFAFAESYHSSKMKESAGEILTNEEIRKEFPLTEGEHNVHCEVGAKWGRDETVKRLFRAPLSVPVTPPTDERLAKAAEALATINELAQCSDDRFAGYSDYINTLTKETLIFISTLPSKAAEDSGGGWVSVEEKRPAIGVIVNIILEHQKKDVYSGFRANGGWYCFVVGCDGSKQFIPNGIKEAKITHWQPLPTPPKQS